MKIKCIFYYLLIMILISSCNTIWAVIEGDDVGEALKKDAKEIGSFVAATALDVLAVGFESIGDINSAENAKYLANEIRNNSGISNSNNTAVQDFLSNVSRPSTQDEMQAKLEKIKQEDEQHKQELIRRFEDYNTPVSTGNSSVTSTTDNQNIGNPQYNNIATKNNTVVSVNPGSRARGTGNQRVGGNPTNRTGQTGRHDQSANPNASNNIKSRQDGAQGSQNYNNQHQTSDRSHESISSSQINNGAKVVRSGVTQKQPQQPPKKSVETIAEFTPKPRSDTMPPSLTNPAPVTPSPRPAESIEPNLVISEKLNNEIIINPQQLSGAHWYNLFPPSSSITDLESPFKENVQAFINALKESGATIIVNSTLRPKNRALLMSYSWQIANKKIDPQNVPVIPGVEIIWTHRDLNGNYSSDASIKAAQEMVRKYGIVYAPATSSNHISGLAIDMNIKWENWPDDVPINIMNKYGEMVEVNGVNKSDNNFGNYNTTIIEIGKSYGVLKLLSDPPHWSNDGR